MTHLLQTILTEINDVTPYAYSGRGMGGRTCLGVNVSDLGGFVADIVDSVINLASERLGTSDDSDEDDFFDEVGSLPDALRTMRTDSMGRGIVVYFPNVPFTEGRDEEEGSDEDQK